MAVVFVANNLAHDATHTFQQQVATQLECDSCHVFKGTLVSSAIELPVASFVIDLFSEEPLRVLIFSILSLSFSSTT